MELFGIKLVGVTAENGKKLLVTLAFIGIVLLLSYLLRAAARPFFRSRGLRWGEVWALQIIRRFTAALFLLGLTSIWFDDPGRLATVLGLVSAGLAFTLQKAVTAIAGYFVILRGRTFHVGDRMGGVRGDVIALGFMQSTIMEMGQPPAVQADDPAMWVQSRQ